MVAYRMKHNAVQMPVIKPVLIVYIIRTLTIVSVFRKPVRFFASIMHKDDAIRASATTALAKAKYSKYDILAKLANVLRRMAKLVKLIPNPNTTSDAIVITRASRMFPPLNFQTR